MKTMIDSMAELHEVWHEAAVARNAEVPSLDRIKELREQEITLIVHLVRRLMNGEELTDGEEPPSAPRVKLKVFTNTAPARTEPRGIASPAKSDEIRQFEASVRAVFGEVDPSTTAWPEA